MALLGTIGWAFASIWYPMGYDQGIMASVGDAIIRGGLPYRDAFDMKGPLTFYVFALAQSLFGRVMWGIRLVDLGFLIASALGLYSLLRRIVSSDPISRWLALSLVLAAASRSWFHVSQPDGWASALVVIALGLIIGRNNVPTVASALAGALIGASALIKPLYILFLAVPFLATVSVGMGAAIRRTLLSVLGAGLPIAATVGWFVVNGAFDDLIEVQIPFNLAYSVSEQASFFQMINEVRSYFMYGGPRDPPGPFGVLLVPILAGVVLAWKERRTFGSPLLGWLGVSCLCVVLQGKFYVYHWLIAFPALLAVAGIALARISREGFPLRVFTVVAIGVFVAEVALDPAIDTVHAARFLAGIDSRDEYLDRFGRFDYRPHSALNSAIYIKAHSEPTDSIGIYGNDAIVQFLSERPLASRFVFSLPLGIPDPTFRQPYRSEFIADLKANAARYVVLGSNEDQASLSDFPELKELLRGHYELETAFGRLELYRLKEGFTP
jgi:hypothetical protein